MKNARLILFLLLPLLSLFIGFQSAVFAQTISPTPAPTGQVLAASDSNGEKAKNLQDEIKQYESKITELQGTKKTLASQISLMDSQIHLTELKINDTQTKIDELQKDITIAESMITDLESNITSATNAMVERISASYKLGQMNSAQILLSSKTFNDYYTKLNYLKIMQAYDKKMIYATEQAKVNYQNQQSLLETKQKDQEQLKEKFKSFEDQLANEKKSKQVLLSETQNNEKKYQSLLASARSEYEAIQGIVSGLGTETEVGTVEEGQKIASIIPGASCNSSAGHLHFIVRSGSSTQSPFNYLSSIDHKNCSGSSCDSGDGDSFNPSGSWRWPMESKITMNQGYGSTWAVKYSWVGSIYSFHNGIDIVSSASNDVKAVKKGTLYRGSYGGTGGCRLRYVRVKHDEGGLDTLYLHVNYF